MVFFSIIMPVYNRAGLVARALRSCVSQSFGDFEIVVVDDGSDDDSVEVVRSFDDPRIRLIEHARSRGRSPARNKGMAAARGAWFVFLDSDDELLEGALEMIHRDASAASPDIVALRYMCVDARGGTSPDPPNLDQELTYEEHLRWLERSVGRRSETLPCTRASTFPAIRFPEGHAEETLYHLDLARMGKVWTSRAVARLYHHDAENQVTKPDYRRTLDWAADAAANADIVMAEHGPAMSQHAPGVYAHHLRVCMLQHFLAGHRREGLRYARECVRLNGPSLKLMVIVLIGLIGRVPLARSQALQTNIRRMLSARSSARLTRISD